MKKKRKTTTVCCSLNFCFPVQIKEMKPFTVSHLQTRWETHTQSRAPGDPTTVDSEHNGALALDNPLALRLERWRQCGASHWVLNTIARGYKIQFARKPPTFEKIIFSHAVGHEADILQTEIDSLLDKKAIREVPAHQSMNGFYSRYFLVKKKGGGCVLYWTFELSINT